jgi:SAM-dependent methyltransferase
MVPGEADASTFWDHVNRYRFALQYTRNRAVLDVACGEGYGTYAISAAGAAKAVGVDISADACEHAREKYGVDARVGDACALPLESDWADVVVSYETLEHVADHDRFLTEICRVLKSDGMLVISTPNRDVYRETCEDNEFHVSEISRDEFAESLSKYFRTVELFSQRVLMPPIRDSLRFMGPELCLLWLRRIWSLRRTILLRKAPTSSNDGMHDFGDRDVIAGVVQSRANWFHAMTHPSIVRPESRLSRMRAVYVIAVCRSPIA